MTRTKRQTFENFAAISTSRVSGCADPRELGPGSASVRPVGGVLKQHCAVARKVLDQRQRGAADRARVRADDAGDDLDVGQAAAIERFDVRGDPYAELL